MQTIPAPVLRRRVALRTPFAIESLPLLSRVHRAAFRPRRRLSKRFVGKPAKKLFRWMVRQAGFQAPGVFSMETGAGRRKVRFNTRNTQFGALYLPQNKPVYEPETSALIDLLVGDGDVFFDIGANWGWYALLVASRKGFGGSVHAFEPYPPTYADLASVVEQSGLGALVSCHEVALADREGSARMGFSDGVQSGLARLETEGSGTAKEVRVARLDALNLPLPQLIKIDAEDHELEVLQGAEGVLAKGRPMVIFENWLHRDNPALTMDPISFLAERGYRFFHPGWCADDARCVLPDLPHKDRGEGVLALLPLIPEQRFHLPSQLNILAVPAEKVDALAARFGA